ncbi:Palmitoyltransferase ZDHHC6 [Strongyloides ratti]|uniref:Palmitoyltransferase n=1 Tax=Strongyloides ratti TaxID=34506 RepID=A0A090MZH8_STRRB|nr:Palmitoyltransferase ZDHHC6 [Strongyloides ratti]CEF68959.1 Palmitoyltransferase ZDHHC6 [Strongyloides ratti]
MNIIKRTRNKLFKNEKNKSESGVTQICPAPNWEDNIKKKDKIPNVGILKRLFHPGPIFTLILITVIAILSFYLHFVYFNYTISSIIFSVCYAYIAGQLLMNYICACYYGPGYLPKNWEPIPNEYKVKLQKCNRCQGYKAPRSHHCRKCNNCCMKMDHHCPYINNCLGFDVHIVYLLVVFTYGQHFEHLSFKNIICAVVNFAFAFAVNVALSLLLFIQMKAVVKNKTQIESFIYDKMMLSQTLDDGTKSSYPYDLGWWENLRQVFLYGPKPKGNGIWYDTIVGTDNFTLSGIQKMLKAEKMSYSRKYEVINSENEISNIFKLFLKYGFSITWNKPCCNGEDFISVKAGEIYLVNKGTKHWIYGERIYPASNSLVEIKGWFPRRLARLYPDELSSDDEK